MKVKDLITALQKVNGESRVFMGYDGNIVVTEPAVVAQIASEGAIGTCWFAVQPGDVVILCTK